MSVSVVREMYEKDWESFQVCGFSNQSYQSMITREKIQNSAFVKAAGIFCMGEWYRRYLIERGISPNKIYTVGAGINLDANKIDASQKEGNKILFVGRDFKRKNGPLVLEAFQKAREKRRDIELYIAGPSKQKDADGVHWLGDVSSDRLAEYFNRCDVFCMPSKFEAYGIVFIEALTYGLPCIGRNAFEMPYLIQDGKTGFLLQDEDAWLLAQLMLRALEDSQMKENVVTNRAHYLKEYSWDMVARKMAEVIDGRNADRK